MLFENHKHDHEKKDEDPKAKEQNVLELLKMSLKMNIVKEM